MTTTGSTAATVDVLDDACLHLCSDGRLTYLPALDPDATDVPPGPAVRSRVSVGSIPPFAYYPWRDGSCWICAYADALRDGRVDPYEVSAGRTEAPPLHLVPPIDGPAPGPSTGARDLLRSSDALAAARRALAEVGLRRGQAPPSPPVEPARPPAQAPPPASSASARDLLRSSSVLAAARCALAEAESSRRAAADATAPRYREATPEEVRAVDEAVASAIGLANTIGRAVEVASTGATPEEAVAMVARNAPLKDDVLEVPPEAVDSVSKTRGGKGRRRKKFSGDGGGQQSMF